MNSAFCNMLRDNTATKYGGFSAEVVQKHGKYSRDYMGIKFEVGAIKAPDGKFIKKDAEIEAGNIINLIPPCGTVKPFKYKTLLSVNPILYKYGIISAPTILEEGDEESVVVSLLLAKDIKLGSLLKELDHLIRAYVLD